MSITSRIQAAWRALTAPHVPHGEFGPAYRMVAEDNGFAYGMTGAARISFMARIAALPIEVQSHAMKGACLIDKAFVKTPEAQRWAIDNASLMAAMSRSKK